MSNYTVSPVATVSVNEIIVFETLISQKLRSAKGTLSERQAAAYRAAVPPEYTLPQVAYALPPGFWSSPISADVYSMIAAEFKIVAAQAVTDAKVSEARLYTSNLMGVDLNSVHVEVVPSGEWDRGDGAEGFQIRVGLTDHLVFVPDEFCSPVELLCHEFGHAAHTTAQRKNGEVPFFFVMPTSAEFVAHFCQYNYLLDHGSRAQFISALGQLTTATFALSIMASQVCDDFESFLKSENSEAIVKAMPMEILERTYWEFSGNRSHLLQESMRGMAIILALWLVDDHEGMKRFISSDRIDRAFDEKLAAAFTDVDFRAVFEGVNDQIYMLLKRFNR